MPEPDELFFSCPTCWLAENPDAPDWQRWDAMVLNAARGTTTHGYEGRHQYLYRETGDERELERAARHLGTCGSPDCGCARRFT